LAHILRSACRITGDPNILVIGSQSILGKFSHVAIPDEAWMSVEADISFFDDPDAVKADLIDGAIGEASSFHDAFGVYGQGVTLETATLPDGWRDDWSRSPTATSAQARRCALIHMTWCCRSWWPTVKRTSSSPTPSSHHASSKSTV
jgi:hypothetical protein